MCKVCGQPEGVHPEMDSLLGDVSENLAQTLQAIAGIFEKRAENSINEESILGASLLVGLLSHEDMPVPDFSGTATGCLVLDWRMANRILEIECETDGKTFEFLMGVVEPPDEGDTENAAQLVAQLGQFTLDDLRNVPEGEMGPCPLGDWLATGHFDSCLDRYIYQDENEAQCSDSETGCEPPNTTN